MRNGQSYKTNLDPGVKGPLTSLASAALASKKGSSTGGSGGGKAALASSIAGALFKTNKWVL